jgi:hypothetical protein
MAPGSLFLHGAQVRFSSQGHTTLIMGGTAAGLPDLPDHWRNSITRVVIRCLGGAVNMRDDGITADADSGFPILEDETLVYDGDNLENVSFFSSEGSPILRIWYMGV